MFTKGEKSQVSTFSHLLNLIFEEKKALIFTFKDEKGEEAEKQLHFPLLGLETQNLIGERKEQCALNPRRQPWPWL